MTNNFKRLLKIGGLLIFFLTILFYTYYRARDLLRGVDLEVAGVENGQVYGRAKNAKHLTLNGREIFLDKDWNFRETILLLPGYNLITIKTEDKFGKVKEKNYQVMLN